MSRCSMGFTSRALPAGTAPGPPPGPVAAGAREPRREPVHYRLMTWHLLIPANRKKIRTEVSFTAIYDNFPDAFYSHSMVAGGFGVMS